MMSLKINEILRRHEFKVRTIRHPLDFNRRRDVTEVYSMKGTCKYQSTISMQSTRALYMEPTLTKLQDELDFQRFVPSSFRYPRNFDGPDSEYSRSPNFKESLSHLCSFLVEDHFLEQSNS